MVGVDLMFFVAGRRKSQNSRFEVDEGLLPNGFSDKRLDSNSRQGDTSKWFVYLSNEIFW